MSSTLDYILSFPQNGITYNNIYVFKDLVHSLSREDLKILSQKIKKQHPLFDIVKFHLSGKIETPYHNKSVSTLLKWFCNKKSGKVITARKELNERFNYLSYNEQIKTIHAFLAGSKNDRERAYLRLRRYWNDSFYNEINELWNKYHETGCAILVARYFPLDIVKRDEKILTEKVCYQDLALGLGKDKNYIVKKELMIGFTSYLYVMAKLGRTVDGEEANEILYKAIIWHIYFYLNNKHTEYYKFSFRYIQEIKMILSSMGYLGLGKEIIAFYEWEESVYTLMMNNSQINYSEPTRKDFFQLALANLPKKYKYLKADLRGDKLDRMEAANPYLTDLITSFNCLPDNLLL
jgi:hypothetical protein